MKKGWSGKKLEDAADDQSLPICWKGTKLFKSISDVKNYFKPLVLSFKKGTIRKNVQLQIPPEAYLIITVRARYNHIFTLHFGSVSIMDFLRD